MNGMRQYLALDILASATDAYMLLTIIPAYAENVTSMKVAANHACGRKTHVKTVWSAKIGSGKEQRRTKNEL